MAIGVKDARVIMWYIVSAGDEAGSRMLVSLCRMLLALVMRQGQGCSCRYVVCC